MNGGSPSSSAASATTMWKSIFDTASRVEPINIEDGTNITTNTGEDDNTNNCKGLASFTQSFLTSTAAATTVSASTLSSSVTRHDGEERAIDCKKKSHKSKKRTKDKDNIKHKDDRSNTNSNDASDRDSDTYNNSTPTKAKKKKHKKDKQNKKRKSSTVNEDPPLEPNSCNDDGTSDTNEKKKEKKSKKSSTSLTPTKSNTSDDTTESDANDLSSRKKKKTKKEKKKSKKGNDDASSNDSKMKDESDAIKQDTNDNTTTTSMTQQPSFPYPTDPDDHCETPLQAYKHIIPLLQILSKQTSKPKTHFQIYDPYYCNGSIQTHLSTFGYTNVYNKKEDCYQRWNEDGKGLGYDVLITNPPYSSNHVELLFEYITSQTKPWFLLLPTYVHKKPFYKSKFESKHKSYANRVIAPFYLFPKKRYVYNPPKDFRLSKKSSTHVKTAPFVSMWYCYCGDNKELYEQLIRTAQTVCKDEVFVARSRSALRDLRRKNIK